MWQLIAGTDHGYARQCDHGGTGFPGSGTRTAAGSPGPVVGNGAGKRRFPGGGAGKLDQRGGAPGTTVRGAGRALYDRAAWTFPEYWRHGAGRPGTCRSDRRVHGRIQLSSVHRASDLLRGRRPSVRPDADPVYRGGGASCGGPCPASTGYAGPAYRSRERLLLRRESSRYDRSPVHPD